MTDQSTLAPAPVPVNLANCADEPIHLPGTIQAHGAMLVLDAAGTLEAWSANAPALLCISVQAGMPLAALEKKADLR